MHKYSLQKKIFILSLFFMLIPLIAFTTFNIFTSVKKVEENYRSNLIFGMKKIGSVTEMIFDDIDEASLFILVDPDIKNFFKGLTGGENAYESSIKMGEIYNSLNYLKNTNNSIQSIQIAGTNGQVLANGYFPQNITNTDWEKARLLNGQSYWGVEESEGISDGEIEKRIYQCRLLRNPDNTQDTIGLAKVYLNTSALEDLFINSETNATSYFIMDEYGKIRYASISDDGPKLSENLVSYEQLCEQNGGILTIYGNSHSKLFAAPHYLQSSGWIVYSLSEPVAVNSQLWDSISQLLILVVFCFAFCFSIARIISRRMSRPLENIAEHMKLLEDEQFSARVSVNGNDEISLLARQFNAMAEKIQSLIEEVYLVNLRKKELELRSLHAQVNPHFLYNTLDMIYWTAKMENAPETSDMISSLSCFFRQALSGKDEFTSVENEIEHLRYYIILRRQSNRPFDFSLDAEDCLLPRPVVKLVLQPLVENAILHGIQDMEHGKIEVKIFSSGEDIIYTITDNGRGVDILDINTLLMHTGKDNRGFGIKNINDRIQLIYGKDYGIHFENISEGGTKVTVIQPGREGRPYDQTDDRRR